MKIIDFINYSLEKGHFEAPSKSILTELSKDSTKLLFFYHNTCPSCKKLLELIPKTKKIILVDTEKKWGREMMPLFGVGNTPTIAEMKNNISTDKLISGFTECYQTIANL